MKLWSTNTNDSYFLNLSNEHGPCAIKLNTEMVKLEYEVNDQPFEKTWPISGENPDVRKRLALIPILGFISNQETQAKCCLNTILTAPLSFDKNKDLLDRITIRKDLYPEEYEKIEKIKTEIKDLDTKIHDLITEVTTFFRTEIQFCKTVRHNIEEILETPDN